ncbi:hypothetical protein [Streptococcus acidominimus]|uniref:Phage protein n=1 Tax=Streptococcus acidominimus TaxID=1326 RepID=A0A1Q8EF45_STRAI|nr:hypothetical protein [Streptococcus acidominimus]MBF0847227.1 hypothetical protein [Streptococcus danieliae]MBF0818321.1 hypothetical protein [Streptococcus acidominimus]MBF0838842.1 hypothetical protein [Streptococcus acidominimus]MBF0839526.1 hypothetical protein [Streptococcus acidominimus]OLF50422.1 hypothetical protein BU200_02105 [Streptococcus acidominimus]
MVKTKTSKQVSGTTKSGFKYKLDEARLNNYELVEAISEVDANPMVFPKMIKLLLGEQVEALKDHVRDENGLVSTERMAEEITEIFNNHQVKN